MKHTYIMYDSDFLKGFEEIKKWLPASIVVTAQPPPPFSYYPWAQYSPGVRKTIPGVQPAAAPAPPSIKPTAEITSCPEVCSQVHYPDSKSYKAGCGCTVCIDRDVALVVAGHVLQKFRQDRETICRAGWIGLWPTNIVPNAPAAPVLLDPMNCKACNYLNDYMSSEYLSDDGSYTCRTCRTCGY